ncbi:protein of unknown function [Pararobbsia alpina]
MLKRITYDNAAMMRQRSRATSADCNGKQACVHGTALRVHSRLSRANFVSAS